MELVITEIAEHIVCAWFEGNMLSDVLVCNNRTEYNIGDIYIGKVKNLVNNINASFIDIGSSELCFLQCRTYESPFVIKGGDINCKKILKREEEVIVQITKDSMKTKNQAVTSSLSLPGRYLVLTKKNGISISKKITDVVRRKELKELFSDVDEEANHGFIVRTNAADAPDESILAEKTYLEEHYEAILKKAVNSNVYTRLYKTAPEYVDAVKDSYNGELTRIITDIPHVYDEINEYVRSLGLGFSDIISFYDDKSYSLDAMHGLSLKLKKALMRKVWLDCGAYLVIDITEACVVIDVNSGKAVTKKKDSEETFYKINIEAAKEIMRQLKLRNLSGIIIADFIDMQDKEHNEMLLAQLRKLAKEDKVKTNVLDITALGLVEMTRMKQRKPLHERLSIKNDDLQVIE